MFVSLDLFCSYFLNTLTLDEINNLKPEINVPCINSSKFFIPFQAVKVIKHNVTKRTLALIKNLEDEQFRNNCQVHSLYHKLNLFLMTVSRIQPHLNLLLAYSQMPSIPDILLKKMNKVKYETQQKEKREKIEDIYEDVFEAVYTCKILFQQIKFYEKVYIDIRHSLITQQ